MIFVIEGTEWGDEGKGKITDFLARKMDVVVRHQGGNNAGHSVVVNGVRYALQSLPSGILSENIVNVIANGCVINPKALIEEIGRIKAQGIERFNLLISNRAHVIMPYHLDLDGAYEESLGNSKIGTTKKGIGPCYMDKMARIGIRMGDLLEPDYLKERLTDALKIKNIELRAFGKKTYEFEPLYQDLLGYAEILRPFITDTSLFLNEAIEKKKKILFEGAQANMLCIENGTYPYVTSSSPLANGVPLNAGIPPKYVTNVIGVLKAYATRVGEGPFVTELNNELGSKIREIGHEYGVVTKRPRRIGYLDLVIAKQAVRLSGINYLAIMLLDVLTNIKPLRICTGYSLNGKEIDYVPSTVSEIARCLPIYKEFPGWREDIGRCKTYDELPYGCKEYLSFIEKYLKTKIAYISVSPAREETIVKEDIFHD